MAGLIDDLAAVAPDVPFLCGFPRAMTVAATGPYPELADWLGTHRDAVADVRRTLAYLDAAVLARTARAPALFSVALMDPVCPPSTVFAAYNAYGTDVPRPAPKDLTVYEHNGHEGGQWYHEAQKLTWLRTLLTT